MQLYCNEQTACGTPRTVWQCFTVNASVFLCRLLACRRATVFNQQTPIGVSPQTNIFVSCFCCCTVCVLYALSLLSFPHGRKLCRWRLLQRRGISVIWQKKKKWSKMFIWGRNISFGNLEPKLNSPKLKYTVCMQFTNIKVLLKKIFTFSFLCVLYKALFVLK